ncbi:ATP-binding protein [Acrocarpospora corrugata]|nr:ATP-binding protein [Acrocarpospora corrugata]
MTPYQFLGSLELPCETTAVPTARHFVRDVLTGTGFDRIDDAELLVSELAANSVRHVGSGLAVAVTRNFANILIEVTDLGSPTSAPHLQPPPDGEGPGGFGLVLVDQLASAWGSYAQGGCQVTWFTLSHPGAAALCGQGPTTHDQVSALLRSARGVARSLPRRPHADILPATYPELVATLGERS